MKGAVTVLTGASRGLGYALALGLLDRGHQVAACMREPGGNEAAVSAIEAAGGTVVEIDVTKTNSVSSGVGEIIRRFRTIDNLINNAGIALVGPVEAATVSDLMKQFDVNVFGPHRMVRAVAPHMRTRARGLIVQISSGAGRFTVPGRGCYSASKWALEALSETLRWELAAFGISCVIVELGPIGTELERNSLRVSDTERARIYDGLERVVRDDPQFTGEKPAPDAAVETIVRLLEADPHDRPLRLVFHPNGKALSEYNSLHEAIESDLLRRRGYADIVKFPNATSRSTASY